MSFSVEEGSSEAVIPSVRISLSRVMKDVAIASSTAVCVGGELEDVNKAERLRDT